MDGIVADWQAISWREMSFVNLIGRGKSNSRTKSTIGLRPVAAEEQETRLARFGPMTENEELFIESIPAALQNALR
jgi:hypothetical protein